ncbi:FHA domain-containing protein [Aeoliella sp. ICT_H6.2]|uniref:FHA domain-containing protein n=1 Tax=Aeoliella straminimaris TaxID=2954799 RepID=A0A9X2FDA6_9BACT|nr:FHA domain-containing protein [Aeoliella straminimaris]
MFSTTHPDGDVRPRFEYYPLDSTKLQTVEINEFPFVVGRSAAASFQINSTSVSREHAEVVRTPTGFCVRDLGSTNGTTVNGCPVRETPIVDGDSVSFADVEMTFVCTSMNRLQRTLTKPLPRKKPAAELPGASPELAATRSLSEALLLQAIPLEWQRLTDTDSGEVLMNTARVMPPLDDQIGQADAKVPTRVAARLELLAWHLAAEQMDDRADSEALLLCVTQQESLDERLLDAVDEVAGVLRTTRPLGVVVNWEWATAAPDALRHLSRLQRQGYRVVYNEFAGGGGGIESMETAVPEYLVLSSAMVHDVVNQPRRMQRLEIVRAACAAQRIKVALPANIAAADQQACCNLGIHFAQQCNPSAANDPLLAVAPA